MPVILEWQQIALRLMLTVVAGLIIGFNRGEHGRPAGMRTTLLVCLAASLSMLQANLLMNSVGKAHDSFVVLDLMRLPLGILSGMGFIGAGAILRKDSLVLGVTTRCHALVFNRHGPLFRGRPARAGTIRAIPGSGNTLGAETHREHDSTRRSRKMLTVILSRMGPSDEEIRASIEQSGCKIISWGIRYTDHGQCRRIRSELERRVLPSDTKPPAFISELIENKHVLEVQWKPQGLPAESASQQSEPKGTPLSISGPE